MVKNDRAEFSRRVLELLQDRELHALKSSEAREHARAWSIGELTKELVVIYETTVRDYQEDYGERRMPVWELLMDKRWWKINNKIFRKKTNRKLQEMRLKLKRQLLD
jgi:hypothetical protein